MHGNLLHANFREQLDKEVVVVDHQMHIQRKLRCLSQPLDDR